MEVFIYCVAIGIIVAFAIFAIGYNLGKGEFDYERTDKGELSDNNNSGIIHFDSSNNSNNMVGDTIRKGSN